jgi:LuxR family maltose regulon positive regulatory protein
LIDAERAHAATGDEPHEPSVGRALSVLANVPASIAFLRADVARLRGDATSAIAYDQQALSHLGEGDWLLRSHVSWNLGVADWLRGRLGEAERALSEVVDARRAIGEGYLAMRVAYDLGQVQRAQGRLDAALDTFGEWLGGTSEGRSEPPHLGMAHLGLAEVLYERDELAAAHQHATRAVALSRRLAFTQPLASALGMLARIQRARGDADGAFETMDDAERVELSSQVVPLLNPVPGWRARFLLDRGEVDEVARWTKTRGLAVNDEPTYPTEGDYLVLARVLLATQQQDQAVRLLARLGAQAAVQGRTGSIIEVGALHALALAAAGDEATAMTTLAEALALAGPEGYVRVFVDEGPAMAHLLGRLAPLQRAGPIELTNRVPQHYVDQLTSAARRGRTRAPSPPLGLDSSGVARSAEPLSDRELQVLGLLAAGKSNQEIADELVVVRDTVKKHVGHILTKLGAANRTQAVARARALKLLP